MSVNQTEFEQSIEVAAETQQVFEFLSDVKSLPQYLPTVQHAEPQDGDRIRTQGKVGAHTYDSDGYFRVDADAKRLEWGSDGENNYSGWMQVERNGTAQSLVTVHIHYAPPEEMAKKMGERSPGGSFESAIQEGVQKSLQSIKQICEGKGQKEEISANQ